MYSTILETGVMAYGLSYALMYSTLETKNIQFFIHVFLLSTVRTIINVIIHVCLCVFKVAVKEFPLVG